MTRTQRRCGRLLAVLCCGLWWGVLQAQEPERKEQRPAAPPAKSSSWTYDEALGQLRLYPRDPYLQFVVLQLGQREGRKQEAADAIRRLRPDIDRRMERTQEVDLFSLFSGALAVQESLQLDSMVEASNETRSVEMDRRPPADAPARPMAKVPATATPEVAREPDKPVPLSDLQGPTVQSHPWKEMLAGRTPNMSALACCVPQDFYYVQFRSVNKLLTLLEQGDVWGTHLFSQAVQKAYRHDVRERLLRQLAVETNPLLQPFYDLAIQETAVVGSDLFATEGSDVTLLFRVLQPAAFKTQMDGFLTQAEQATPGTVKETGVYRGVAFVHVTAPDRSVHVYSAYPAEDLHVRSNSLVAFQRVLDVIVGAREGGRAALGDTEEFAYISTLLPYGAEEEDGLVYLSDPFIRHMVGPQLKLTESRRRICQNHLRLLKYASALYRTEHGRPPASMEDLVVAKCTPGEFNAGRLVCPCGGQYTLAAEGRGSVCTHHGTDDALLPCCEIPLTEVTSREAEAYRQFVQQYSQYWRTFFDPIALRVQVTAERYRLETIVLPLIDNTLYSFLALSLGGEPQVLDLPPVPDRTIFSAGIKLDKSRILQQLNWSPPPVEDAKRPVDETASVRDKLLQMGLAMHNYHDVYKRFPTVATYDAKKKPLLSWRVSVLPYLEQQVLYEKFRQDEPWDSPHNRQLIEQMPEIFRSSGRPGMKAGTTCFLLPTGPLAVFSGTDTATGFREVQDGTSNTVMVMYATEKRAVVWTKPDDYPLEAKTLRDALFTDAQSNSVVCFADGSVRRLRGTLDDANLLAIFTRSGGEVVQDMGEPLPSQRRGGFWLYGLSEIGLPERDLYDFVTKGLSDTISLHTYDADQFFDFQLMGFLGRMVGSFSGRQGFGMGNEFLPIVFLGASLNSPVYVSVPLDDTQVVDSFLEKLDVFLADLVRHSAEGGFIPLEQDFYRLPLAGDVSARSFGLQVGPIKWRFFWARLGKTLYVASKPYILEDLAAKLAGADAAETSAGDLSDQKAHAMIRIRPEHWQQVLPNYRLGWAERHRHSCLENVGRLSNVARMVQTSTPAVGGVDGQVAAFESAARQLYGLHFFCPEGGQYLPDGKGVRCSHHGSALDPRQAAVPQDNAAIDTMLREFSGLTVTLTFLEDGLHAVLLIDR